MVMDIAQPIIRERDHIKHACVNINPEATIPMRSVEVEISWARFVRYIFTICGINMRAENPPPRNPVIVTHNTLMIRMRLFFLNDKKLKHHFLKKRCIFFHPLYR